MGPISAQGNPKLWEPGKQKPHEMLRPGTLEGKSQSQEGCSDGDPQTQLCCFPHAERHYTAHSEMGDVQLMGEEAKGASGAVLSCQPKTSMAGECDAITVNSSPRSKELGWKPPFDSGKFALILLAWGERSTSPTRQPALQRQCQRKKERKASKWGREL